MSDRATRLAQKRRELYAHSMAAFTAARVAAAKNPQPETPEWDQWQNLVSDAIALNGEYIRTTSSFIPPGTSKTISD